MTVNEMRNVLDDLVEQGLGNMELCIVPDYGDISHTKQALYIREEPRLIAIKESAYSESGYKVEEIPQDEWTEEREEVVGIAAGRVSLWDY